ncbi:hypothetical protein [Helcococcus kunzii]|uniref:hypothetical protein n=1 Tax=Helcococcus kunzii TaxID=40091 RepID=UPI001C969152|nr:hypothetical protein [Helcococcus kunzii]QZO76101.1 hypothetical protein HIF96_07385 [Helcococcus kunzii]
MLDYVKDKVLEPYKDLDRKKLRDDLAKLQRDIINENIPVLIMVDGFESSNRGYIINEIVKNLDTKHYKVNVFDKFKDENKDYNYTVNFWRAIPSYGDISVFYRSMYFDLFNDLKIDDNDLKDKIKQLEQHERFLADDNHIILKFFTDIDEKTQKKNIKELEEDRFKEFLVSKPDKDQQKHFDKYKKHISKILEISDFDFAKWNIIPADDKKISATMVLSIIIEEIKTQMKAIKENKKKDEKFKFNSKNDRKIIESIDTKQKISEKEYDNLKGDLQDKVGELAYELYKREIPTIILFEGIDAAGKGGTIERLVNEIDPRVYNINPISAPSDAELDHHYLWRFFNNMPKKGHIAIFDRSWYGRVLVERVEKFANEKTWSRAYDEINTMEEMLIDQGVFLLKYHLVISKDEQERRFKDREDEKPYKITDEDWRNRDKWDEYIIAMDDMIHYTSTTKSPWKVISSEDKKFARIEVLKDFIERAEKFLKDE